jgi:hypothetical protein
MLYFVIRLTKIQYESIVRIFLISLKVLVSKTDTAIHTILHGKTSTITDSVQSDDCSNLYNLGYVPLLRFEVVTECCGLIIESFTPKLINKSREYYLVDINTPTFSTNELDKP